MSHDPRDGDPTIVTDVTRIGNAFIIVLAPRAPRASVAAALAKGVWSAQHRHGLSGPCMTRHSRSRSGVADVLQRHWKRITRAWCEPRRDVPSFSAPGTLAHHSSRESCGELRKSALDGESADQCRQISLSSRADRACIHVYTDGFPAICVTSKNSSERYPPD